MIMERTNEYLKIPGYFFWKQNSFFIFDYTANDKLTGGNGAQRSNVACNPLLCNTQRCENGSSITTVIFRKFVSSTTCRNNILSESET